MTTTIEQLLSKAGLLGARVSLYDDTTCVNVVMPITKWQEKDHQTHGDLILLPCTNTRQQNIDEAYKFMCEWEERWSLKNDVKKKEIEDFLRTKLGTDDLWAKKALLLIYGHQTSSEQACGRTVVNNSVGFTGHDSEYLSSLARQLQEHLDSVKKSNPDITECEAIKRAWLSKKQLAALKKTIKKYWRQVSDASDEMKLLKAVKNARGAQQMTLKLS